MCVCVYKVDGMGYEKTVYLIFELSGMQHISLVNISNKMAKSGYGGSIRQSGGKMGERGSVLEEDYFLKKASEILITILKLIY